MSLSSSHRPTDIVAGMNQKALLDLAEDQDLGEQPPRSYRLPQTDELKELFPDLEIVELIGTGGMGCVFKARQTKLDRTVAVKILPRELARDDLFSERFSREARAMARLNHPNIVSIHDFGQTGDVSYLTMEYMDGMNLRELIDAGALDPHAALGVFAQVCNALGYAHDEGVVHRDIKPENILFNRQGHVALADFGLARLAMDSNCEVSLTQTRQAMGTLNYMAPEQYENPKTVDHRADIYALGVLLYELMTGKVPRGSFPPVSTICPTGPNVDAVVNRCLQVAPDDRYQSVASIVNEITDASPTLSHHVNQNGTFTNFLHLGAAPLRIVGKLMPVEVESRNERFVESKWIPLHQLTYMAMIITFLTLMFPWQHNWSRPAIVSDGGDIPYFLSLVLLAALSQLAKYRNVIHPVRWFALVFFGFMGCFGIGFSVYHATAANMVYVITIGILAFEFGFSTLRSATHWFLSRQKPGHNPISRSSLAESDPDNPPPL